MGAKRAKTKSKKVVKVDHHAKKQKIIRNSVGAFMIILMVTSIFGVMLYADPSSTAGSQQLEIDGYTFTLKSEDGSQFVEMTNTPAGKSEFIGTRYYAFPGELFETYFTPSIDAVANTLLNSNAAYLVVNVSNLDITGADQTFALDYQAQDIARSGLAEILTIAGVQTYAGLAESSQSFQVPVISCENATQLQPVMIFDAPSVVNKGLSSVSIAEDNPYCISFYSTDFQTTLDMVETLKFEMVKLHE